MESLAHNPTQPFTELTASLSLADTLNKEVYAMSHLLIARTEDNRTSWKVEADEKLGADNQSALSSSEQRALLDGVHRRVRVSPARVNKLY